MIRVFTFILSLIVFFILNAQTVQRGIVREYNGKSVKTPLSGVELQIRKANSTISDKDGKFTLEFNTLKPGERVNIRRLDKTGYEIFNKDAVEQWNINPNQSFEIVMCRSDKFKKLCDIYRSASSASYKKQREKEEAALRKLKVEGKLKDEEYRKQMIELEDLYERKLDSLENYVDRFARIDLSEISFVEREILELVQQGKMEEAISRYEALQPSTELIHALDTKQRKLEAAQKLVISAQTDRIVINSLYAVTNRQIQTLMLVGGRENNKKIQDIYVNIAEADTTNIGWLLRTGYFIKDYIENFDKSLYFFQLALSSALSQYGDNHQWVANCYEAIGNLQRDLGGKFHYHEALGNYEKALIILKKLFDEHNGNIGALYKDIGVLFYEAHLYDKALEYFEKAMLIFDNLYGKSNSGTSHILIYMGSSYAKLKDYPKAFDCYQKALEIEKVVFGETNSIIATIYNQIGLLYYDNKDYSKAFDCYQKALDIEKVVFGETNSIIAGTYNNTGLIYFSQQDYPKALNCFQKALEINEKFGSFEDIDVNWRNIARVYYELGAECENRKQYETALDYYSNSLSTWEYKDSYVQFSCQFTMAEAMERIYSLLTNMSVGNDKYLAKLKDFMKDKMYVVYVDEDKNTPATEKGLKGEYFLFEYGDWDYRSSKNLFDLSKCGQVSTKDIVISKEEEDGEDIINYYHFENLPIAKNDRSEYEDQIGLQIGIKYIESEYKVELIKLYEQWKYNNDTPSELSLWRN